MGNHVEETATILDGRPLKEIGTSLRTIVDSPSGNLIERQVHIVATGILIDKILMIAEHQLDVQRFAVHKPLHELR